MSQLVIFGNDSVLCSVDEFSLTCKGTIYESTLKYTYRTRWFWILLACYVLLLLVSATLSFFVVALSAVDILTLKIIQKSGQDHERVTAQRLYGLLNRYNQVLITLTILNAMALEATPIIMDRISNPIIAVVLTSFITLFLNELLPVFLLKKYGIMVDRCTVNLIWILTILFFPLSYLVGRILDYTIGQDYGRMYARIELKELFMRQGPGRKHFVRLLRNEARKSMQRNLFSGQLTATEIRMIRGVLGMGEKTVSYATISLEQAFMIEDEEVIDKGFVKRIFAAGHRYIPVYSGTRNNVVGIVPCVQLGRVDISLRITAKFFLQYIACKPHQTIVVSKLSRGESLFSIAQKFRSNQLPSMVMVTDKDAAGANIVGLTTLHDVLNQILKEPSTEVSSQSTASNKEEIS